MRSRNLEPKKFEVYELGGVLSRIATPDVNVICFFSPFSQSITAATIENRNEYKKRKGVNPTSPFMAGMYLMEVG